MPSLVQEAIARAQDAGFGYSCDPDVGRLMAVLAAHLPARARVLELGSGTGVGTAWTTSGLLPRPDVIVITAEKDPATAELAAQVGGPEFVDLRCADALTVLGEAGEFDLIFADAPGGKWKASTAPSPHSPHRACSSWTTCLPRRSGTPSTGPGSKRYARRCSPARYSPPSSLTTGPGSS
jgi:hypothetical protein